MRYIFDIVLFFVCLSILLIIIGLSCNLFPERDDHTYNFYIGGKLYTVYNNSVMVGDNILYFYTDKEVMKFLEQESRTYYLTQSKIKKEVSTITSKTSWYGKGFNGRKTASGEIYDENAYTCASPNLPFDTLVSVTNLENNKTVIVRVNDRGPYDCYNEKGKTKPYRPLRPHKERALDLSKKAFAYLADTDKGVIDIEYKILN